MSYRIGFILAAMCLVISGCPFGSGSTDSCETVMVCSDDKESYCDPPQDGGCGETTCYYFTTEWCNETCKEDVPSSDM